MWEKYPCILENLKRLHKFSSSNICNHIQALGVKVWDHTHMSSHMPKTLEMCYIKYVLYYNNVFQRCGVLHISNQKLVKENTVFNFIVYLIFYFIFLFIYIIGNKVCKTQVTYIQNIPSSP